MIDECSSANKHSFRPTAQWRKKRYRGFSLIELIIIMAIIVTLSTIASGIYTSALAKSRITKAAGDIKAIAGDITVYFVINLRWPDTLADVEHDERSDPWGNPYQYLNFDSLGGGGKGKMRKDRFEVPLNSDFDLYSMGADGKSVPPLTAKASHDDIIRANDGGYIGLASEY